MSTSDAVAVPSPAAGPSIDGRGPTLVVRRRPGVASALDGSDIAAGREVGAAVVERNGEPVPFTEPFWFAVAAFRSDVRIVR